MTQLVGLKMMGIRSIGDEPHIIEFLRPLTIIQGENGTGKTTTIEALSYLTTGTLPSGKMASFIHNSKMVKKKRVDALIQLKFKDFRGNTCTATKRMMAAVSATNKISTKSDEFTLHITSPNGDARGRSAKVADFNKEVENQLGVSSAVLQHVIFCHQEDSCWPLGEPKEIKTKFDAIFEVERFVKVMDAIKKNAKELDNELKVVLAELPHLEKEQNHVAALYLSMNENTLKIAEINEKLKNMTEERNNQREKLLGIRKELEECRALEHEIELKNTEIDVTQKSIAHVDSKEPLFEGTKEELIQTLESLKRSSEYTEAEKRKESSKLERQKVEKKIKMLELEQKRLQSLIGRADGRQTHYDSVRKSQKSMLSRIADALEKPVESENASTEIANFIQQLQNEIATSVAVKNEESESLHMEVDKLRTQIAELKSSFEITEKTEKSLKSETDATRREIKMQQKQHSESEMNELQANIYRSSTRLEELQSDKGGNSIKLKCHLDSMDEKVDELKTGFTHEGKRPKWSDDDVVDRLDNLKLDVSAMRSEVGRADTFNAEEADLVLKLENLKKKEADRREAMKKLELLKTKLAEEDKKLANLTEERKSAAASIEPLRVELLNAEAKQKEHSKETESEKAKLNSKVQRLQSFDEQLRNINKELATIKKEMEEGKLDSIRKQLINAEEEVDALREELERLALLIADCDSHQQRVRSLEEQLRAAEGRDTVERLQEEVRKLRSQCTRSSKEINVEVESANKAVYDLERSIQHRKGTRDQLEKSAQDMKSSLGKSGLRECRDKLKKKLVKKLTTQAAIEDLRNFAKVMDDCIISYHAQKMEQINIILSELWPSVYQGNDIETIQIKSQPADSSEKRKSYDYSVVMIVDGEELEMRDRCSAGQKMLASILIRIALTEVFSGNCPILALDEPTTNLDASKVENVGTMLKDLLAVCNGDENARKLQLVVITHDQRLVEHLYAACRPEYVYGLSKNEYGVSRIRQHTHIAEVCSQLNDSQLSNRSDN